MMKFYKTALIAPLFLITVSLASCDNDDEEDDQTPPQEICDDGVDNDGDGLVDCDDPDCASFVDCLVEICDDGIDNDEDGLVDCDDPDCMDFIDCIPCFPESTNDLAGSVAEGNFEAPKVTESMSVDGCSKESVWMDQDWKNMNYNWLGTPTDSADYYGRFKLAWDEDHLYILVEVVDDFLNPTLSDGLANYWKGDYVEVFLDEDQSGGDHRYNHQAFAYHVTTEGHSIDQSTQQEAIYFDDHVEVLRTQEGDRYLWELAIKIYDDSFDENSSGNVPVTLVSGKTIGFSLAYGDNDGNSTRENFVGSKETHGWNNDQGYINSDVFGSVLLTE